MMRSRSFTTWSMSTDLKKSLEKRYASSSSARSSGFTPARSMKTRRSLEASTMRSSKLTSTRASSSCTYTAASLSRVKRPTQPKWSMWAWLITTCCTEPSVAVSPKRSRTSTMRAPRPAFGVREPRAHVEQGDVVAVDDQVDVVHVAGEGLHRHLIDTGAPPRLEPCDVHVATVSPRDGPAPPARVAAAELGDEAGDRGGEVAAAAVDDGRRPHEPGPGEIGPGER